MAREPEPHHTDDEAANPLAGVGERAPDDLDALSAQTAAPPARVAPVVVPRWVQMVLLPLAIIGAYGVARAAGSILLLFIIAGLIALLLNPFVALLQRLRFPRGLAVAVVVLAVLAGLTGIGFLLANPVSDQVSAFQKNVPGFVDDANKTLADVQGWLDRKGIALQVKQQGQTGLQTLGKRLTGGAGDLLSFTRDALQLLIEGSIALILVIVLSVYMLIFGQRIGAIARAVVPTGDGSRQDDFPTRIQAALFGYVRGQLLFSLIMGTSAGAMLWVLGSLGIFPEGKTYALLFGAFYGFAELIPYVGPAVGGFPPVIIAALGSKPLDAVWLIVGFTVLQQLEGHVVAPTVFGQALRINPLLVLFALLLGGQLYGFVGAFIALPIAAILRESLVYFRRHLVFERWDLPAARPGDAARDDAARAGPATAAGGVPSGSASSAPPEASHAASGVPGDSVGAVAASAAAQVAPCPECGAPVPPGARACPACGTELAGADAAASAAASAPG